MPSRPRFDVVAVGNAIVDVLGKVDDAFLHEHGLAKGAMILIDADRADFLYDKIDDPLEDSGGSAANTAAGLSSLGGRAAYIGKVSKDPLGACFHRAIKEAGVHFQSLPLAGRLPTARSLVVVTPDGQRTMNTYLGACVELGPDDIDEELIKEARVTYLEGYLFDKPKAKNAFRKAAQLAHEAGHEVSLTLSDKFCVERHREEFLEFICDHVDLLFANESELMALYDTGDFDVACEHVRKDSRLTVCTRGKKGAVLINADAVTKVRAEKVASVIDTTGAGDIYAAGFLFGYARNYCLEECGRIASLCAAEIIGQLGARPRHSLAKLIADMNGGNGPASLPSSPPHPPHPLIPPTNRPSA